MTDLANRDLALDARQAREGASIARNHLRVLRMDLQVKLYALAAETVNSAEFQGLRADLNVDLEVLDGIYRRLDRLATLLDDQADAELTFHQAQVGKQLANIVREGKVITTAQADYFVKEAVEAFQPSRGYESVQVDPIAVEQVLFALTSNSGERRLRLGVTLDTVREAVLTATAVTY